MRIVLNRPAWAENENHSHPIAQQFFTLRNVTIAPIGPAVCYTNCVGGILPTFHRNLKTWVESLILCELD